MSWKFSLDSTTMLVNRIASEATIAFSVATPIYDQNVQTRLVVFSQANESTHKHYALERWPVSVTKRAK